MIDNDGIIIGDRKIILLLQILVFTLYVTCYMH